MIFICLPDGKTQKLRWTCQHPSSRYGLGVVLIGKSGEILDGTRFKNIALTGAKIVCDLDQERRRVAGALAWGALGLSDEKIEVKKQGEKK